MKRETKKSNNEIKKSINKDNKIKNEEKKPLVNTINLKLSFIYSLIGGVFASLSSVCGKVALDSQFLSQFISSDNIELITRAISIGSIFICTTMQWRYAAKGMDLANSTLTSTVITTSSNFFFTAFFGWLFFKEQLSFKWWIGAFFIMFGLFLMNADQDKIETNQKSDKLKKKD
ncbi:hypothetical protein DDB_G0268022 [Dictyostelium discoideum AX4]|uniref:EamA domain-containing protein n=1 Tax=Dictyostelium discoideum TaxID=44689 RepID=Q55FN6_DICDI|nr:hypothetical protein DDB_G0268022 [Dictyostelium discoideum AX4]EAL73464.1 hypothetical protein DDB_G0268022 [Dictyostelium discoideum AX4]|eukprot:XP_647497.1 hypothetical protein DDB_G0268022 [Dictyostelium discoideum AX4]